MLVVLVINVGQFYCCIVVRIMCVRFGQLFILITKASSY